MAGRGWLPPESRCATRRVRLYEKAAANYRCALQNLNNLPKSSSSAAQSEGAGAEILELRRQALTGEGDVALLSSDYLNAITGYEAVLASLPLHPGKA